MVASRRPERPVRLVAAEDKRRHRRTLPTARCVVCGAELRLGHALGDLVCDVHPIDGYNPRHDPALDERILVLLWRAQGQPLNLYRALGCDRLKANYDAIAEAVQRINASGLVRIVGAGPAGRKLAVIGASGRETMQE